MIIEKNRIIELANTVKLLITDECVYNNIQYYIGVMLDEQNEPTKVVMVFEKKEIDGETFIKVIEDNEYANKIIDTVVFAKED